MVKIMPNILVERFQKLEEEKKSILCVGLDPALPIQRERNVVPDKFIKDDDNESRLNFCLDIIDQVNEYAIAAKPNEQYIKEFSGNDHKMLAEYIKKNDMISIYDFKLGDIRGTAESALFYINKWGYSSITMNDLPGNLEEVVKMAHDKNIGIFVLTLMSNPEAIKFMKNSKLLNKPVYIGIAEDVNKFGADGCVVGATNHVTDNDILAIRETAGEDKIFLIPGIGAQKGNPEKVINAGGRNILINVGRGIIYSKNPEKKAKEYYSIFSKLRGY